MSAYTRVYTVSFKIINVFVADAFNFIPDLSLLIIFLNQVSEDTRPGQSPAPPMDGLAGALARALLERSRAIHQTGNFFFFFFI